MRRTYPTDLVAQVGGEKVFQFLTEDPFYISLRREGVSVVRGRAPTADVEVEGPSSVVEDVVQGKVSPVDAVLSGALKVRGDLAAAGRLASVVRRVM